MRRTDFDGVMMGGADDRVWRGHEPRWWQLRRWWRWLRSRRKARIRVEQSVWSEERGRYSCQHLYVRALPFGRGPITGGN